MEGCGVDGDLWSAYTSVALPTNSNERKTPPPRYPPPAKPTRILSNCRYTRSDMIIGWIVDFYMRMGQDVSAYTDSTTGTFRKNM